MTVLRSRSLKTTDSPGGRIHTPNKQTTNIHALYIMLKSTIHLSLSLSTNNVHNA